MNKIAVNLRILRKIKNASQETVADELEMPRSRLASYEEGRAEPPYDTLIRISDYYRVSVDALLRGDFSKTKPGDLLKIGKNRVLFPVLIDDEGEDTIEVIGAKASAGYLNGYADPEYMEKLPLMRLPFQVTGKQRTFSIQGDSMPPLKTGDYVTGKYVESAGEIQNGKTYILVTKNEGIVYKRIEKKSGQGVLELHSDNKVYEPYTVKMQDVLEVWEFICSMSRSDKKAEEASLNSVMSVLHELQAEVQKLRK